MLVDSFQEVHRSESVEAERCRRREEVLSANQWKLDRSTEDDSSINLHFSIKELREAIMTGANTSPGRDRLSYELFKHLDDMVLDDIQALLNTVWAKGCLPKEWKHAVVVTVVHTVP